MTSANHLFRSCEQILLGLERYDPQSTILPRTRYFLEKYNDQSTTKEVINDFFEVVKQINHFPVTSLLQQLENDKSERLNVLLRLSEHLYHQPFSPFITMLIKGYDSGNASEYHLEALSNFMMESIDESESAPMMSTLQKALKSNDDALKVKYYLNIYNLLYEDQSLALLSKAFKHWTYLNSDLPLWSFLSAVTGKEIFHRIKVIREQFPDYKLELALSKSQFASKLWLVRELDQLNILKESRLLILCGWSGLLSYLLLEHFTKDHIAQARSVDLDQESNLVAEKLNQRYVADEFYFKTSTSDVYQLDYHHMILDIVVLHKQQAYQEPFPYDVLINTSCEHLGEFKRWYQAIPSGKIIVLQSNDYFSCDEHVNCVADLEQFKKSAPMAEYLYSGTLQLGQYQRFMLIGRK